MVKYELQGNSQQPGETPVIPARVVKVGALWSLLDFVSVPEVAVLARGGVPIVRGASAVVADISVAFALFAVLSVWASPAVIGRRAPITVGAVSRFVAAEARARAACNEKVGDVCAVCAERTACIRA